MIMTGLPIPFMGTPTKQGNSVTDVKHHPNEATKAT